MTPINASVSSNLHAPAERFRPSPWGWYKAISLGYCAVVLSAIAIGFACSHGVNPSAIVTATFWTMVFCLPLVFLTVYLLTSEIRTDQDGISWRTWWGWSSVPWSDVLDYYEIIAAGGSAAMTSGPKVDGLSFPGSQNYRWPNIIATTKGALHFHSTWSDAQVLRRRIAERAFNAKAKEWGLLGTRPALDWPRTFDYDTRFNRWGLPTFRGVLYSGLIAGFVFLGPLAVSGTKMLITTMGWPWALCIPAMSLIYLAYFIWMLRMIPSFAEMRVNARRSILLTKEGVVSRNGHQRIELPWENIRRVSANDLLQRVVVESDIGTITFDSSIRDYYMLKRSIEQWAINVEATEEMVREEKQPDNLRGRIERRQKNTETRFYSYRTSFSQVYLWGAAAIPLAVIVVTQNSAARFEEVHLSLWTILIDCAVMAPTLWGWWRFFASGITTDADGLTQRTLFGRKRMLWTDVQSVKAFGAETFTFIRLSGPANRITYWAMICNGTALADEIEGKTGMAVLPR